MKKIKRITFAVDDKFHALVKSKAAKDCMTLKNWIIHAIAKALQEEKP